MREEQHVVPLGKVKDGEPQGMVRFAVLGVRVGRGIL